MISTTRHVASCALLRFGIDNNRMCAAAFAAHGTELMFARRMNIVCNWDRRNRSRRQLLITRVHEGALG